MSYLTGPTLLFSGTFQADVPTENNAASFVSNPPGDNPAGGLNWNPMGSGAFRLLDCTSDPLPDGQAPGPRDPVRGAVVRGAHDRVSAKIVDLDPQWQGASELWGLRVEIVGADGTILVAGEFEPAGFRDSWAPPNGGMADAQARFQSVLHDVVWAPAGTSPWLDRLRAATSAGRLSIRMTTHGFGSRGRTAGQVAGAIGPYLLGEPHRFVSGRRFPQAVDDLGDFDAELSTDRTRLVADLATASSWTVAPPTPLGPVRFGVLERDDTPVDAAVTDGTDVHLFGATLQAVDPALLAATGGIVAVDVPPELRGTIADHPLALVRTGASPTVLARETRAGWLVRADHETRRTDAGMPVEVPVRVTQYGAPHTGTTPLVQVLGPFAGQPPMGSPTGVVTLTPVPAPTQEDGWTVLHLDCGDPAGSRSPIDGQVYPLRITIPDPAPPEQMAVLVFDHADEPDRPTWTEHVHPILAPYAALYPVMTRRLLDLSDYDQVRDRRQILQLALSLDVGDPNSMPVTRDLSGPKRRTLLRWLALPDLPFGPGTPGQPAPAGAVVDQLDADTAEADPGDAPFVGKQAARETIAAILRDGRS